MRRTDFQFAHNFPDMTDAEIEAAYAAVSAMYAGVPTLWGCLSFKLREAKRTLCMNLLTARYLLDLYPSRATGVMGNGGMTVASKSVGGTALSFVDMDAQEGIKQLNSNVFGQKALQMIQCAPERYGIYAELGNVGGFARLG